MPQEIAKEVKRYGIMVNSIAPGGMLTPGCLTNGPVRTLEPEKQKEIMEEMMVAKSGETIVADSGMMRNIMKFQPEIQAYPAEEK